MRVAVICVGNEWQGDDGFGPAVGRYLNERYELPADVAVLDRAVMGYGIVPDLQACDVAVVVDALDGTGTEPGTVLSFDSDDMANAPRMASLHDVRFADVLSAAHFMGASCGGHGFGVQVESRGDGTLEQGLSAAVEGAIAPCARAVVRYLSQICGVVLLDRWERDGDVRACLSDADAYVRDALIAVGAEECVDAAMPHVVSNMPDYEADALIARMLQTNGLCDGR